jgi:hypothetical protein
VAYVLCCVRVLHDVVLLLLCWSSTSFVVFAETETHDVLKGTHAQDAVRWCALITPLRFWPKHFPFESCVVVNVRMREEKNKDTTYEK